MNLIQIQEHLKNLPLQVVQSYTNGANPQVPPYLALGEMKRREVMAQQHANETGMAQGKMPSVKEQVEQQAGLMTLQQRQQQQAQQQMLQQGQRQPMPVPENIPQPQAQQEEQPQYARGGLARLPVNFGFAGGGIVAFDSGGYAKPSMTNPNAGFIKFLKEMGLDVSEFANSSPAAQKNLREMYASSEAAGTPAAATEAATATPAAAQPVASKMGLRSILGKLGRAAAPAALAAELFGTSDEDIATLKAAEAKQKQAAGAPATRMNSATDPRSLGIVGATPNMSDERDRNMAIVNGQTAQSADSGDTGATNAPTSQAPAAPVQKAMPSGVPSAVAAQPSQSDQLLKMALGAAQPAAAPTEEGAIATSEKFRKATGMDQPYGIDQLARIKALQEQYEKGKPSALDDLIRIFGQAGQYKGLTGLGPAYTANQDEKRAADLAFANKMNQMLSGVEDKQRGEAGTRYADLSKNFGESQKEYAANQRAYGQNLASLASHSMSSDASRYAADQHLKGVMAQVRAMQDKVGNDPRLQIALLRDMSDAAKSRLASAVKNASVITANPAEKRQNAEELAAAQAEVNYLNNILRANAAKIGLTIPETPSNQGGAAPAGWGKATVK